MLNTQGFPPDPKKARYDTELYSNDFSCAREQSRTATPVTALPPESSASTNFATRASEWTANIRNVL